MYLAKLCHYSNTVNHASCSFCCLYLSHHALIFLYTPAAPLIGCMLSSQFATLNISLISITNIISCHMAVKFIIIIIIIYTVIVKVAVCKADAAALMARAGNIVYS